MRITAHKISLMYMKNVLLKYPLIYKNGPVRSLWYVKKVLPNNTNSKQYHVDFGLILSSLKDEFQK